MVLLLLSPAPLLAQSTPPPADNPGTIRLGTLTIKPLFAIKNIGRDNNVFNESTNPKSDFTMTFAPSADVTFQPGRFKLTLTLGTDYVYFHHYESERGTNYSSALRGEFDLGALRPYGTLSGTNTRERYNNEVDARARHHDQAYGAGVVMKLFSRTNATIGVRHIQNRFDPGQTFRGEDLADSFDSDTDMVEGSIGLALTPLTSFSVNVSNERQRFVYASERDQNTLRILPTFTFSPAGLLNGTISVGVRRFTAFDPRTPDFTGVIASGAVGVTLYDKHRLDFSLNRDLSYSYDRAIPYYIATGGSLAWKWLFAGPFDLTASIGRNNMRYHGPGDVGDTTTDTYQTYSVGAGYRLGRPLRFGINAEWVQRDSTASADRVFENNKLYGTVTWGT
jgi:putative beta-barrel porin BBP2